MQHVRYLHPFLPLSIYSAGKPVNPFFTPRNIRHDDSPVPADLVGLTCYCCCLVVVDVVNAACIASAIRSTSTERRVLRTPAPCPERQLRDAELGREDGRSGHALLWP